MGDRSEWRAIETAPRIELDDLIVFNGKLVQCGQWWEGQWVDSLSDRIDPAPTHWMPLPAPPALAAHDAIRKGAV